MTKEGGRRSRHGHRSRGHYSNRSHALNETNRQNRRQKTLDKKIHRTGEPLRPQEGLISDPGEDLETSSEIIDMEQGKEYPR